MIKIYVQYFGHILLLWKPLAINASNSRKHSYQDYACLSVNCFSIMLNNNLVKHYICQEPSDSSYTMNCGNVVSEASLMKPITFGRIRKNAFYEPERPNSAIFRIFKFRNRISHVQSSNLQNRKIFRAKQREIIGIFAVWESQFSVRACLF